MCAKNYKKAVTYNTKMLHSNQSAIFSIQNKQKGFAWAMEVSKFRLFHAKLIATEAEEETDFTEVN